MKTIGVVGGLAWPSTAIYYQKINELVASRLGGHHCARLVIIQTDLEELLELERAEQWNKIGEIMLNLAERLQAAGADFFILACNTMHKSLMPFKNQLPLPFVDIVQTTGRLATKYGKVGLIGSKPTMTDEYFLGPLAAQFGLETLVPANEQQAKLQKVLHEELVKGLFLDATRDMFGGVIADLARDGAEVVILGCTEFGKLIGEYDSPIPLLDTLSAHVEAVVDMALSNAEDDGITRH